MLILVAGYVKKKEKGGKNAACLRPKHMHKKHIPTHDPLVLCEVCDLRTSSADSHVAQLGLFVWFPGTTGEGG